MLGRNKGDKKSSLSRSDNSHSTTTTSGFGVATTTDEEKTTINKEEEDSLKQLGVPTTTKTTPKTTTATSSKRERLEGGGDTSTSPRKKTKKKNKSEEDTKKRKLTSAVGGNSCGTTGPRAEDEIGDAATASPSPLRRDYLPTVPMSTSALPGLLNLGRYSPQQQGDAGGSGDAFILRELSEGSGGGGNRPLSAAALQAEALLSTVSATPGAAAPRSSPLSATNSSNTASLPTNLGDAAGRLPSAEALLSAASLTGFTPGGGHRSIAELQQTAQLLERYSRQQQQAAALNQQQQRDSIARLLASSRQAGNAAAGMTNSQQLAIASRLQQQAANAFQGTGLTPSSHHQLSLLGGAGPLSIPSTNLTTPLMRATAGGRSETTHDDLLRAVAFAASDPLNSSRTVQALRMRQDLNAGGLDTSAIIAGNPTLAAMAAGIGGSHFPRQPGGVTAAGGGAGGHLRMPMTVVPTQMPSITGHPPVILSLQLDRMRLSPFQCLARQQIEIFEATEKDVQSGARGRNNPIILGQVGIRCKHCAHITPTSRKRGAVYFPTKYDRVYQTAVNMATGHLCQYCEDVPKEIREELLSLKEQKSTGGGGKEYWANGVRALGVLEAPDGLRFAPTM